MINNMFVDDEEHNTTPCIEKDVEDAASDLQYAIRWFFHVYVSWIHSNVRWKHGMWWYNVIQPWELWPRPIRLWKFLIKKDFVWEIYRCIRLLISVWWK